MASIEFTNRLSHPIELVVTPNNQPMQVLTYLAPGWAIYNQRCPIFTHHLSFTSSHSYEFNAPSGFAGNFKHTQGGRAQGVTLFEISVRTNDNNIYYDLSVIDGFNVPMKVRVPDG